MGSGVACRHGGVRLTYGGHQDAAPMITDAQLAAVGGSVINRTWRRVCRALFVSQTESHFLAPPSLFRSFWMAGFESACQINRDRERVDLIAGVQHDRQVRDDYAR